MPPCNVAYATSSQHFGTTPPVRWGSGSGIHKYPMPEFWQVVAYATFGIYAALQCCGICHFVCGICQLSAQVDMACLGPNRPKHLPWRRVQTDAEGSITEILDPPLAIASLFFHPRNFEGMWRRAAPAFDPADPGMPCSMVSGICHMVGCSICHCSGPGRGRVALGWHMPHGG